MYICLETLFIFMLCRWFDQKMEAGAIYAWAKPTPNYSKFILRDNS